MWSFDADVVAFGSCCYLVWSLCECRKEKYIFIILYIFFVIFHTHTFFISGCCLLEQHKKKSSPIHEYTRSFPIRTQKHFSAFFSVVRKQIREIFSPARNYEKTFICNLSADWIGNRLYGTRLIIIIIFNYTRSSFVCDETLKSLLSSNEIKKNILYVGKNKKEVCLYNF